MGATRDTAVSELNIRGISINPASSGSATINVVPSDSGVMFINKLASDTTYNLPAVADSEGKMFWFFDAQATNNVIITAPDNTMIYTNSIVNTTITGANAAGGSGFVICDGSKYYFFEFSGVWTTT